MPSVVTLDELREYMRRQSEEDKKKKTLAVEAESITAALAKAAIELGVPVRLLTYEVIQQGSVGTLGVGKKPWKLSVYEKAPVAKTSAEAEEEARREAARASE